MRKSHIVLPPLPPPDPSPLAADDDKEEEDTVLFLLALLSASLAAEDEAVEAATVQEGAPWGGYAAICPSSIRPQGRQRRQRQWHRWSIPTPLPHSRHQQRIRHHRMGGADAAHQWGVEREFQCSSMEREGRSETGRPASSPSSLFFTLANLKYQFTWSFGSH